MPYHFHLFHSLFFGFLAWLIASLGIANVIKKPPATLFLSFTSCAVSVIYELVDIKHRANMGDTGGILDTIDSVIFGLVVMLAVTIVLNMLAVALAVKKE